MPSLINDEERSPWSGRRLTLSKSKLMAFEQCPKRLWLQVHQPEKADIAPATLEKFAQGHRLGELARSFVPGGMLVTPVFDVQQALSTTTDLLRLRPARPLLEAAFRRDDVFVRVDILQPQDAAGSLWNLIEVKNSRRVRQCHVLDVTSQAWSALGSVKLGAVIIRHVSAGAVASASHLRDQDVTGAVRRLLPMVPAAAAAARTTLRSADPNIRPGPQCRRPYRCEFIGHCTAALPFATDQR